MKLISTSPLSAALLAALLAWAGPALAQSTTDIVISGKVNPGTCAVNVPPTVLDDIDANDIVAEDNADKAVTLQFTGCIGVRRALLTFSGTPEAGDTNRWANTASADPASGIAVSLREGATGTQYLYQGLAARQVPLSGASGSYPMRAAYHRRTTTPGPLAAGNVAATITINVAYE